MRSNEIDDNRAHSSERSATEHEAIGAMLGNNKTIRANMRHNAICQLLNVPSPFLPPPPPNVTQQ